MQRSLTLGALTLLSACGEPQSSAGGTGGGSGAGGRAPEFPATCPGYESLPGAGCPEPCVALVPGGPDGRAYCTRTCGEINQANCVAGQTCAWGDGLAENGELPDTCLPGKCNPVFPTSCPDDFICTEQQFCYPSPGTVGTACHAHEVATDADCAAPCTRTLTLSSGRLMCTAECEASSAGDICFAGDDCQPVGNGEVFVCMRECNEDVDCPGTPCAATVIGVCGF